MPPFGLYQIPTHHLNKQSPLRTRPVYNSLDFVDDEAASAAAPNDGSTDQLDDPFGGESKSPSEEKRKDEKRMRKQEKREKKKQSMDANAAQGVEKMAISPATPLVNQTPTTSNHHAKSMDGTTDNAVNDARSSVKKRKRKSELVDDASVPGHHESSTNGFALGTDFLEGIKSAVGNIGAGFGRDSGSARTNTPPSKKKSKLHQKSEATDNKSKATDKTTSDVVYTPTPSKGRGKANVNKSRDSMNAKAVSTSSEEADSSAKSPHIPVPRKTPVPVPREHPRSILRKPEQKTAPSGLAEAQAPVTEASQPRGAKGATNISERPIPFNLPQASVPTLSKRTTSKRKPPFGPLSSPTPRTYEIEMSELASVTSKDHVLTIKPNDQISLTTLNLMRYTEPLNDEPKPRPRAASVAASTATSTTSSASSMSIKEAFARVAKPYTRSGAEVDPFVLPEVKKKKKPHETHDEASLEVFVERFRASRNTVNFTHEQEYLTTHLSWRAQNDATGPLPCLGQATGCTPKREVVLRLHKEDTPNALKVLVTTDSDARALSDATQRSTLAETFLQLAVTSRVPVPIGRVEGTWTLFCPKYTDIHVDKYGFGQRTLTIHSIAGFKDKNAYTARLSIPPRSMLYNILSFSAPPHASFRTTTLRTAVEGYKLDVVFLGNGYLQLRVDLNLLLRGKPTETAEGKPVYMEFLGVHGEAVKWREERDELEEVGRRLFAKYDGED